MVPALRSLYHQLVCVPELFAHCGDYCEVATRNRKVYGILTYLYANFFLIRPRLGCEDGDSVTEAADIVSVTPLPYPHY